MTTLLLLRNQWRHAWRSARRRHHPALLVFLAVVALSGAFLLTQLGFFFREVVRAVEPGRDAVAFLNGHLATLFLSLFVLRFFVQGASRMKVRPYLHLPVRRAHLVLFFQVTSLASVHNVAPLCFLVPFWWRHLAHGPYPPVAARAWLAGVVLLILLSHYGNVLLRALLSRSREGMFVALGVLTGLVMLDLLVGAVVLSHVSAFVFGTLLAQRPWMVGLLAVLVGVVFAGGTLQLVGRLRDPGHPAHRSDKARAVPFVPAAGPVVNLLLLECKLVWRCERPKLLLLFSIVFGLIYVAGPLVGADVYGRSFIQAFVGLFASGIFVMNYGPLMFAWESAFFDGVLTRPVRFRHLVLAKLVMLQASCVAFFLVTLPLFAILAPGLLALHVAFLLYNVGVTTPLVMLLAVGNRRRITLSNVSFFNFEGFSAMHWLWLLPTAVPPALVLIVFEDRLKAALLLLAALGLLGAAQTGWWSRFFAGHLAVLRHAMARGFREGHLD